MCDEIALNFWYSFEAILNGIVVTQWTGWEMGGSEEWCIALRRYDVFASQIWSSSFHSQWSDVCYKMWQSHTSLGEADIIGNANIICRRQTSLKKDDCFRNRLFSWQGREDSNPRPTVLEWLRSIARPWNCSLFRTFQCTFHTKPRVVIVSENFWCFFDDMIKFQLTY